jgi:hypothetical protein
MKYTNYPKKEGRETAKLRTTVLEQDCKVVDVDAK